MDVLEPRETPAAYTSPYAVAGLNPAYIADIGTPAGPGRLNTALTSTQPPMSAWYDATYKNEPYGPSLLAQPQVPLPAGVSPGTNAAAEFYMQRLVATAQALIGTAYQHHHDPLWNPYANGYQSSDPTGADYWNWLAVSTNATSPIYGQIADSTQPSGFRTVTLADPKNPYLAQYGTGAAGIDCSDLTGLVYNVAAGIFMSTGVTAQGVADASGAYSGPSSLGWFLPATAQFVPGDQKSSSSVIQEITPRFFFGPNSAYHAAGDTYTTGAMAGQPIVANQVNTRYITQMNGPGNAQVAAIVDQLQPGDLLYIASDTGEYSQVTHVVLWLGGYGTLADGSPSPVGLVISSHDNTPPVLALTQMLTEAQAKGLDISSVMPPPGVQILPFYDSTWFYNNFSHAMRVLPTLTNVSATSSAVNPTTGQPVAFTVTVGSNSGVPTGTVQFSVDGGPAVSVALDATGTATFTTSTLGAGSHTVSATYVSDGTYAGDTVTLTQAVAAAFAGVPRPTGVVYSVAGGAGGPTTVEMTLPGGAPPASFTPFADFSGPVRVSAGVVGGRAVVVAGAGAGGGPRVVVADAATGAVLYSFNAYAADFRGGLTVAVGDVTGDGTTDVVTGAGETGGPHVRVFDGATGQLLWDFMAFDEAFRGGLNVALADLDGDGRLEILASPGLGGGPVVAVFDTRTRTQTGTLLLGDPDARSGLFIAAGDLDGNGVWEVVAGAGPGGGPTVAVFSGVTGSPVGTFAAYAADFTGGVRVGVTDADGDGRPDVVTGTGPGGGPHVRVFDGVSLDPIGSLLAGPANDLSGVSVG